MRTFLALLIAVSVTACAGPLAPSQPGDPSVGQAGPADGTQDISKKPAHVAQGCGGPVVSLSAACWSWLNGTAPLQNSSAGDLTFTFPGARGPIDYLTTTFTQPMSGGLSMTVHTDTLSGAPVYNFRFPNDGNNCDGHANARLFFQQDGDNMSGNGKYEFYRWWALDPGFYQLDQNAQMTISVPFTPDRWSSVMGKRGDASPSATAGFRTALSHVGKVGMTFGGGCFYGHGVNVLNGTAEFTLAAFSAN